MALLLDRIKPGLLVKAADGRAGVTVDDLPGMLSCCSDDETPVVYDGSTGFQGTLTSTLEVIGEENAVADPVKCGAGRGAECCIFLVVGPKGFECERFGSLRNVLIFKDGMNAKRHPEKLFPFCQFGEAVPA